MVDLFNDPRLIVVRYLTSDFPGRGLLRSSLHWRPNKACYFFTRIKPIKYFTLNHPRHVKNEFLP